MDWKRVIDNNITHASSTVENRYQHIKILVKEHFVVGWFDALSDEILACSKYDSGFRIWHYDLKYVISLRHNF